jgi:hypothetical protein
VPPTDVTYGLVAGKDGKYWKKKQKMGDKKESKQKREIAVRSVYSTLDDLQRLDTEEYVVRAGESL